MKSEQKGLKPSTSVPPKSKSKSTKKLKSIGTKEYIDAQTGEKTTMQVVSMEDRDFNFEKIWLGHLMNALDTIGNKKMVVVLWLLHNKNNENIIIANQRQISQSASVSIQTVNETIKALKEVDFLKQVEGTSGVYQINPDVIFKGSNSKRMSVLLEYTKGDTVETKIADNPEQTVITDKSEE